MFEQQTLLEQLGSQYTNRVVDRLHRFTVVTPAILASIANHALSEHWGNDNYVLEKYLSVQIPWSIEQNRYTHSENQFYTTAGHLQTRYGTPIYLVFAQNTFGNPPWRIITVGSQISAPQLPTPPEIPPPPEIPRGAEIVMLHDHILGENAERVSFLHETPPVAQMCAVSGAIQWSLNRHLEFPYFYFGKMNYLVPLYLQSRENITLAPDLVAPIQVNPDSLLVRTALSPVAPYPNARVSVKRHDHLPPWMLSSWADTFREVSRATIDDPEATSSTETD